MQIRQVRMSCICSSPLILPFCAAIVSLNFVRQESRTLKYFVMPRTTTSKFFIKYITLFQALLVDSQARLVKSEQFPMHPKTRNRLWWDMYRAGQCVITINNSLFLSSSLALSFTLLHLSFLFFCFTVTLLFPFSLFLARSFFFALSLFLTLTTLFSFSLIPNCV